MRKHQTFGRNQTWRSTTCQPRDENEVLAILANHKKVRAFGGKHSWSEIALSSEVSVDMVHFKHVQPYERDGEKRVRVGAGCTLQELLDELHAMTDQTLPTLGVIKKQTISGAISTGTHGSGRQSLSHFVASVRVAAYGADGEPQVLEYQDGEALKAARCALGCMGIILSVDLVTVPKYHVRETLVMDSDLANVLERYKRGGALTQFSLMPYRWDYLAFERGRTPPSVSPWQKFVARFLRLYTFLMVDFAIHLGVRANAWFTARISPAVGNWLFRKLLLRYAPYLFIRGAVRVDQAEHVITQRHDLFRHEEMELFVPESSLPRVVEVLRCVTEVCAGNEAAFSAMQDKLRGIDAGLLDELVAMKGSYTHHYAFFFRRVLPEPETLISMTGGVREPHFSIGVFTYFPAGKRQPYYRFCSWLARCMYRLCGARLHWGKHFPLGEAEVNARYDELAAFKDLCSKTDPNGVFRNAYVDRVLGAGAWETQAVLKRA